MPVTMVKISWNTQKFHGKTYFPSLLYRAKFPEIKKFLAKFPKVRKFPENWHLWKWLQEKYPIAVHGFHIDTSELKCCYKEWNNADSWVETTLWNELIQSRFDPWGNIRLHIMKSGMTNFNLRECVANKISIGQHILLFIYLCLI